MLKKLFSELKSMRNQKRKYKDCVKRAQMLPSDWGSTSEADITRKVGGYICKF